MEIKTLYKYVREDGGTTVSPNKPEGEYTEEVRIIAGEGKAVTKDGNNLYSVIDDISTDGYYEVDMPKEETTEVTE